MRSIAPSRYDDGTAFITVDGHQVNNRDPWVYRTTDFGATWKLIVNGIPKSALSYAKVIHEDPVRRGMLYLGTENAIYVTFDAGDTWQPLQNDLPHAPVSGIVVQEHFNDLVISTYGRGFYILDDITPLRAMTPAGARAPTRTSSRRAPPTGSAASPRRRRRTTIRPWARTRPTAPRSTTTCGRRCRLAAR